MAQQPSVRDDLEFMSVPQDEDDGTMNTSYGVTRAEEDNDQVIGGWLFKQSKVC